MSSNISRVELAEEIARSWNARNLPYAVIHGLEKYPANIGRDLDIIAYKRDVRYLVKEAVNVAKGFGFNHALLRWSYWGLYQLVLIDDSLNTSLPLDFLCTTDVWRAKLVQFMSPQLLAHLVAGDGYKGPFRVSSEGRFYKVFVRSLLSGDVDKILKEFALPIVAPTPASKAYLVRLLGEMEKSLLHEKDKIKLREQFPSVVRRIQSKWCRSNPGKCLQSLFLALKGRLFRSLLNTPIVASVSTESFSATTLERLQILMKELFVELRFFDIKNMGLFSLPYIKVSNPPISEFVVAMILERGNYPKAPGLNFGLDLRLDSIDLEEPRRFKEKIVRALEARYRLPRGFQ